MQLQSFFPQDDAGNLLTGGTATVYLKGTQTLATGLADAAGNPVANPVPAAPSGRIQFRAPMGDYDVLLEAPGFSLQVEASFVEAGDLVTQQDLADPDKGALMVRGAVIYVDTIADLQALPTSELVDGQQVQVQEYHSGTGLGGGEFYWDSSSTEDENGGTVFGDAAQGRWIRRYSGPKDVTWFGARTGPSNDIREAGEACISLGGDIVFPDGIFYVSPSPTGKGIFNVTSNTHIALSSGTVIKLLPTGNSDHVLFYFDGVENSSLSGNMALLDGSRDDNTASGGEHGFGVFIRFSENILVENIRSENWWGDGFYVGNRGRPAFKGETNKNITLRRVISSRNRRQGISITDVDGLYVEDSTFELTEGTAPQYGIDIEPNWPEATCENITFKNCTIRDNANAGLLVYPSNIIGMVQAQFVSCVFLGQVIRIRGDLLDENSNMHLTFTKCRSVRSPERGIVVRDTHFENCKTVLDGFFFEDWAYGQPPQLYRQSAINLEASQTEYDVGGVYIYNPVYNVTADAPSATRTGFYTELSGVTGVTFKNVLFKDPLNYTRDDDLRWHIDMDSCDVVDNIGAFGRDRRTSSLELSPQRAPFEIWNSGSTSQFTLRGAVIQAKFYNEDGNTIHVVTNDPDSQFILPLVGANQRLSSTSAGDYLEVEYSEIVGHMVIKKIIGEWEVQDI